jgi:glycosyltransferase involved in cell wall biosynthesis
VDVRGKQRIFKGCSNTVNVLFNLHPLTRAGAGIAVYTQNLVKELAAHQDVENIAGFLGSEVFSNEELQDWLRGSRLKEKGKIGNSRLTETVRSFVRSVPGMYGLRHALREVKCKPVLRDLAQSGYIYHEPNYIPISYSGKQVITVHDLSHIRYPEFHPPERVAFMNRYLKRAIERSDFVVTDSTFVRSEIMDVFHVPGEKVVVTHLGADAAFHTREEAETADVLRQFNLKYRGFVLSVGTLEPRKNLERLLAAHTMLPKSIRQRYPLVLVGGSGWNDSHLLQQIQSKERLGEVIRTGYLPRNQVLDLYASAAIFAYPSLYEGFGLPVLEGFASGTPVLTSNVTSLPEVSGGAAFEVDPYSVEAIHDGLFRLLDDTALRERHVQLGLARAGQFSWARCAEQTVDVYRRLS